MIEVEKDSDYVLISDPDESHPEDVNLVNVMQTTSDKFEAWTKSVKDGDFDKFCPSYLQDSADRDWDLLYQINGGDWDQFSGSIELGDNFFLTFRHIMNMMSEGRIRLMVIDAEDPLGNYMNIKFRIYTFDD